MITTDKVVTLIYDLYVGEEPEELMQQITAEQPLTYCQGRGMMLPLFEANLESKKAGDKFDFRIACADAYGEYDDESIVPLDREMFLDDEGNLDSRIKLYDTVPLRTFDGHVVHGQVIEIDDKRVVVDLNHPLAGEDLHFIGSIIDVHDLTDQERQQLERGCGGCKTKKCNSQTNDNACGKGCGQCCN